MKKQSLTIEYNINKEIKKGDKVKFIDGSGLSNHNFPDEKFYIVFSYPKVLKTESIIKDLEFEVVETGITNKGVSGVLSTIYIQDIAVSYNGVVFHTPSQFVIKLNKMENKLTKEYAEKMATLNNCVVADTDMAYTNGYLKAIEETNAKELLEACMEFIKEESENNLYGKEFPAVIKMINAINKATK